MKQLPQNERTVGPVARVVVQVALTAPVYIFSLFAWIPLASAFSPGGGTLKARIWSFYFGLSAVSGLICLGWSVFGTTDGLRASKKRRVLITIGLVLGCSLAGFFLCALFFDHHPMGSAGIKALWYFGGPAVVAVWNLIRIWKIRPKLVDGVRPERSGTVGTDRAEQAPASPEASQGKPD